MKAEHADRLTGILGVVLSATYVAHARGIEDSMLADEVGVAGVPTAVGTLMMLASAGLIVKARLAASAARGAPAEPPPPQASPPWRAEKLALALLCALVGYVLLLPIAGYVLSIGLLIATVAYLVGAREHRTVALCAVGGSLGLYGLFTVLLQIRMPPGLWPAWMGT